MSREDTCKDFRIIAETALPYKRNSLRSYYF